MRVHGPATVDGSQNGHGVLMRLHMDTKAKMRRGTAFMVKGEAVTVVALHGTKGGAIFATVQDDSGNTDYVDSVHVAFRPVKAKHSPIEAEPFPGWEAKGKTA